MLLMLMWPETVKDCAPMVEETFKAAVSSIKMICCVVELMMKPSLSKTETFHSHVP